MTREARCRQWYDQYRKHTLVGDNWARLSLSKEERYWDPAFCRRESLRCYYAAAKVRRKLILKGYIIPDPPHLP